MRRQRNAVDDFVEEYGLKHGVAFEEYTPGDKGATFEVKAYHTDDDIIADIVPMAEKHGLVVWVETIRVFVKIPGSGDEE